MKESSAIFSSSETTQAKKPRNRLSAWAQKRFGRVIEEITVNKDTTATLLSDGPTNFAAMRSLIHTAQRYSITQMYSIDVDDVGEQFIQDLREAKQRADSQGRNLDQIVIAEQSLAWWNHNGMALTRISRNRAARERKDKTFREINALEDDGVIDGWVTNWFQIGKKGSSSPLNRDHKKIVTADGQRAIITSANIGEHHMNWLDAGVLLDGPVTKVIEEDVAHTIAAARRWDKVYKARSVKEYVQQARPDTFEEARELVRDAKQIALDLVGSLVRHPVRRGRKTIVHSPNGDTYEVVTDDSILRREATKRAHELVINVGKGDIVDVITPYPGFFVLTSRLIESARKGANVNLYIPENNNYALYNPRRAFTVAGKLGVKALNGAWKGILKKAGVHIYQYTGNAIDKGMNHAKAVHVRKTNGEEKVLIGSMNLNLGLLSGSNREIGVVVDNKKFVGEFNGFISSLQSNSKLL